MSDVQQEKEMIIMGTEMITLFVIVIAALLAILSVLGKRIILRRRVIDA